MPSRNAIKQYVAGGYYHVYNRGHNKDVIFRTEKDYEVFLAHFKRHLSKARKRDIKGREYVKLHDEVELIAFCLMPNHFHLVVRQITDDGMARLVKRVCNSYSRYFNQKYGKVGSLFQGRYKAVLLDTPEYSRRIVEYVHRNPEDLVEDYHFYAYSSAAAYAGSWSADWLTLSTIDE